MDDYTPQIASALADATVMVVAVVGVFVLSVAVARIVVRRYFREDSDSDGL